MSGYNQIFVQSDRSDQELVDDVAAATGATLTAAESVAYRGNIERVIIEIESSHPFEEDFGIRFEDFPIVITTRDLDSDKAREGRIATTIFEALRSTGGYRLIHVFDLQRLVARAG